MSDLREIQRGRQIERGKTSINFSPQWNEMNECSPQQPTAVIRLDVDDMLLRCRLGFKRDNFGNDNNKWVSSNCLCATIIPNIRSINQPPRKQWWSNGAEADHIISHHRLGCDPSSRKPAPASRDLTRYIKPEQPLRETRNRNHGFRAVSSNSSTCVARSRFFLSARSLPIASAAYPSTPAQT